MKMKFLLLVGIFCGTLLLRAQSEEGCDQVVETSNEKSTSPLMMPRLGGEKKRGSFQGSSSSGSASEQSAQGRRQQEDETEDAAVAQTKIASVAPALTESEPQSSNINAWYEEHSAREAYFRAKSADFRASKDQKRCAADTQDPKRRAGYLKGLKEQEASSAREIFKKRKAMYEGEGASLPSFANSNDKKLKQLKDEIEKIFPLRSESPDQQPTTKKRRRSCGGEVADSRDRLEAIFQRVEEASTDALKAYLDRDDWTQLNEEDLDGVGKLACSSEEILGMNLQELEKTRQECSDVLRADQNAYLLHEMAQELRAEADRKIYEALQQELEFRKNMLKLQSDKQNAKQSFENLKKEGSKQEEPSKLINPAIKEGAQGVGGLQEIDPEEFSEQAAVENTPMCLPSKDLLDNALAQGVRSETAYQAARESIQKYQEARLRWGKCVVRLLTSYEGNTVNPHDYVDCVRAADAELIGVLWLGINAQQQNCSNKRSVSTHVLSLDKLRRYRPPSRKPEEVDGFFVQANYEWRKNSNDDWKDNNNHLFISDIDKVEEVEIFLYPPTDSSVSDRSSSFSKWKAYAPPVVKASQESIAAAEQAAAASSSINETEAQEWDLQGLFN